MSRKLHIMLVYDHFNTMSQRAFVALDGKGHNVTLHTFETEAILIDMVATTQPDMIICPFLTKRIPEMIYSGPIPCLIVHPGIVGDRGMSSIDYALKDHEPEWGVTLLQAEKEMDAGPIWATQNFQIKRKYGPAPTKSSLYRTECANAAVKCIEMALERFQTGTPPVTLDYTNPDVKGRLRPAWKLRERTLDWSLPATDLVSLICASDSQPGTIIELDDTNYLCFGAHTEFHPPINGDMPPKTLVGTRNGAILITCADNTAMWITHLQSTQKYPPSIKLPSMMVLPTSMTEHLTFVPYPQYRTSFLHWPISSSQDIFFWHRDQVIYLWFNFYNGAMATEDCHRLLEALKFIDHNFTADQCKVLVLMGGLNFFSNGINLNVIEAAADSELESNHNIRAIDDVVEYILRLDKWITISALHGNAGAGGAMMALAADYVWAHNSTLIHPSYKAMALYGSEFWTYSLPKRAGNEVAQQLVNCSIPLSAERAMKYNLVDKVLGSQDVFIDNVIKHAARLAANKKRYRNLLKAKHRTVSQMSDHFDQYRQDELAKMAVCFKQKEYHNNRYMFVTKSRVLPCRRLSIPLVDPNQIT